MNDQVGAERPATVVPEAFEPSLGREDRGLWLRRGVLAGVFAALAVISFGAWYLFTGRSVQIVVTPPPDGQRLTGGLLRIQLADRWLLRPGGYELSAEREGYFPLSERFEVRDDAEQRFAFALEKRPGILDLRVEPPIDALVRVDGEPVGTAPLTGLELAEGRYEVALEAPRYQPLTATLEIAGGGVRQAVAYTLLPDWADVTVTSVPPGATLTVDGEPVGDTPLTAEIASGTHVLALSLDGFKAWERELAVEAMVPVTLPPVALEPADHLLRVVSVPGGASVAVDGEFLGQAPLTVPLRPGDEVRVSFSLPGYRPVSRSVTAGGGEGSDLAVRLVPVLGTVVVRGAPAGAELWVDGVVRGVAGEPIELPAHPHRLEVRREGYDPFRTTVTPDPTVTQVVEVTMASEAERERARTPELLSTTVGAQLKLVRPAGFFRLGSPRREQGRRANEFQRQVQLERPFYVGLREITNEQFQRFRREHDSGVADRETLALPRQPVVRVSWEDAARFCNWLSRQEGLPAAYREEGGTLVPVTPMTTGFRLPTEAEWVLVARYEGRSEGRAPLRYPWGDALPPPTGAANLAGREAAPLVEVPLGSYEDPFVATAPVGEFAPNGAGLFDLGGNVSEWMHDYYALRVADPPGTVDPLGPAGGRTHVVRGASWRSGRITELRLAWRGDGDRGADDIGFRIARYAE